MDSQSCARHGVRATRRADRGQKTRRPEGRLAYYGSLVQLDGGPSGHEAPHDCDDREDEQQMDQAAAHVENREAEQPKHE
jgi:hypothetical protein